MCGPPLPIKSAVNNDKVQKLTNMTINTNNPNIYLMKRGGLGSQ
jgi:hypothetical protein